MNEVTLYRGTSLTRQRTPRTLPSTNAWGLKGFIGRWGVSCERGNPVEETSIYVFLRERKIGTQTTSASTATYTIWPLRRGKERQAQLKLHGYFDPESTLSS